MSIKILIGEVQNKVSKVKKNAKNQHFKNKYANLESVLDALAPYLEEHKLTVLNTTELKETGLFLITEIMSEGLESYSVSMPLEYSGTNKMQSLGSAITYARRYNLMGIFNLVPSDDDDGNAAAAKTTSIHSKTIRKEVVKSKESYVIKEGPFKGMELSDMTENEMKDCLKKSADVLKAAGVVKNELPEWYKELNYEISKIIKGDK